MYRIDNPAAWNQVLNVTENIPVNHGASIEVEVAVCAGDRRGHDG